jgi:F420-non-reducing hydrogenase small subunit
MAKPQVAFYWTASCGGCELAVLELHERILDVASLVDIRFWPVAIDAKYSDVRRMADGELDVTFFNGALRNEENVEMAHLMRQKSKLLVAFGACAQLGGIPGLANFTDKRSLLDQVYHRAPSTSNPSATEPVEKSALNGHELTLPSLLERVSPLDSEVEVDYSIPGCPPTGETVWRAVTAILEGQLPERGAVLGASEETVCKECALKKEEKKVSRFYRLYEKQPDGETCLLEQGIVCAGPATRGGCEAACIKANMPCRGCYGPVAGVLDQGAKLLSALASCMDSNELSDITDLVSQVADVSGLLWRFSLPRSLAQGMREPATSSAGGASSSGALTGPKEAK